MSYQTEYMIPHNNHNVSFSCYGDPALYDEDDEKDDEDDGQKKIYRLDRFPGRTLFFEISSGYIKCKIEFSTRCISKEQIKALVEAQYNNTGAEIHVRTGDEQSAYISTNNEFTTFEQFGGYDSATDTKITIPNECCMETFKKLIDY